VRPGVLSLLDAIGALTWRPARALGLRAGRLAEGEPANLTLVDLGATWTVDPARSYSLSRNTPLAGMTLTGRPITTIVRGRVVMREGEVLV
jgi:dihydroorotase